jgi:pimeloyl-ACP methyl ester carboxylesterase
MGSIDVTGGTDGIEAACEDIRRMARRVGAAAVEIGRMAFDLHRYAVDPGICTAGAIDPHDLLCFQGELLDALDGARGLSWSAAELGGIDLELRAAAEAYQAADTIATDVHDVAKGIGRLPRALAESGRALVIDHDPVAAAQAVVTADPGLADVAIDALGITKWIAAAATAAPDGHAVLTATGTDHAGVAGTAPRNLEDVLDGLEQRNEGAPGAIDVRILTGHGRRRVIVDITGTKTASPLPGEDVTGLITDGKTLIGERSTYENGVLAALRRAGVTRHDDVMLVGHSEGGMVAVTTARDATSSGEFRITHVITAGAPIGMTAAQVPRGVKVLALENARDVVPHLDGVANPDRTNVTTVTDEADCDGVLDCHSIPGAYKSIAADTDASGNNSVRDFIGSADEYLTAGDVETRTYVVTRER